ncbi:MAG: hypothetical protein ABI151_10015 [Chitinophagaceae bacterium]
MAINDQSPGDEVPHDEDVKFENEKEAAIVPLTDSPDAVVSSTPVGETIIPPKEDTLGKSDFPPLTEAEKQPKIDEDLSPNR